MHAGELTIVERGERHVLGPGGVPRAHGRGRSPAVLARAAARQPRPGRVVRRGPVGLARPRRRDPRRGAQRRRPRRGAPRASRPCAARGSARTGSSRATPRPRSRRDIAAHYDLGNELYELMLDPTLSYSCTRLRAPRRDARGGRAGQARPRLRASSTSARATTCSRSAPAGAGSRCTPRRPAAAASRRRPSRASSTPSPSSGSARPALEDRVTVLLDDYRDLRGSYDKLVSIEMIEAVGWRDFGTLFARCSDLLRARRRDAAAGDHDRRPRLRGREGVAQLHAHAHLPQRLPAVARGHRALRRAAHRHAHASTSRTSRRTTPRRSAAGARTSSARPTTLDGASATTSASGGCGGCTSPTARAGSPSAGSASCRPCSPSRAGAAACARA